MKLDGDKLGMMVFPLDQYFVVVETTPSFSLNVHTGVEYTYHLGLE